MSLTSGSGSGSSTYNCTSATVVTAAVIGSSYSEQLSCSLAAQLSASVYTLWLCLDGYGCSFAGSNYTVPFTLTQALPTSGSLAGGQLVNLTGSGVCGGGEGGALACLDLVFCCTLNSPSTAHPQRPLPHAAVPAAAAQPPLLSPSHCCSPRPLSHSPLPAGFSTNKSQVAVRFGSSPCVVQSATASLVTCLTGPAPVNYTSLVTYVTPSLVRACVRAGRVAGGLG